MKVIDIFGADIPFVRFCDIEPIEAANGRSRLEVTVKPHHGNQMGVAHGGLLMTLLDVCMGSASRSAVGRNVVTVENWIESRRLTCPPFDPVRRKSSCTC